MVWARTGLVLVLLLAVVGLDASAAEEPVVELEPNQIVAYRLIQFDRDGTKYGSRRASVNLAGTVLKGGAIGSDVNRRVVVLHIREVDENTIDELLQKHVGGILLVLPTSVAGEDPEDVEQWRLLEAELMQTQIDTALYFAHESERLDRLLASLRGSDIGDGYQFVIEAGKPSLIKSPTLKNYQGWLPGMPESDEQSVDDLPTIALVAHYDTFAAAPALAMGADSNGSGVLALLELARLFSELSEDPQTQARYNLLFVLSGGGHLNYAGSQQWLAQVEPSMLSSIEFVLCIDSIGGGGEELYFHSSKPSTAPKMAPLFEAISTAGAAVGVDVKPVHKKINVSKERFNWEHEQFSMKRVLAATLSAYDTPADLYSRSSIFDSREAVDLAALERNIRVVAEGVGRLMYAAQWADDSDDSFDDSSYEKVTIFGDAADGDSGPSSHFLAAWADYLGRTPRAGPYPGADDGQVLTEMYKVLKQHTVEATEQSFPVDPQYNFYGPTRAVLSTYRVKSISFDLISAVVIAAYLALLHITFHVLFSREGTRVLTVDGLSKLFGVGQS